MRDLNIEGEEPVTLIDVNMLVGNFILPNYPFGPNGQSLVAPVQKDLVTACLTGGALATADYFQANKKFVYFGRLHKAGTLALVCCFLEWSTDSSIFHQFIWTVCTATVIGTVTASTTTRATGLT